MDIAATTPAPETMSSRPTARQTVISSDFETFLKLLTTQLQNQDPLSPLNSDEFAVQLATFSAVEQQVRTNDLLSEQLSHMTGNGLLSAASWIGKEVGTTGAVLFSGSPMEVIASRIPGADRSFLVARDETGREVARERLPMGDERFLWEGFGPEGVPLPDGLYELDVENFAADRFIGASEVQSHSRVREVAASASGVEIILENGERLPMTSVRSVRAPDP